MIEKENPPEFLIIRGEALCNMTETQFRTLTKSMRTIGIEFVEDDSLEVVRKIPVIPEGFEINTSSPDLDSVIIDNEEIKAVTMDSMRRFFKSKGMDLNKTAPVRVVFENLVHDLGPDPIPGRVKPDEEQKMLNEEVILTGVKRRGAWRPEWISYHPIFGIVPDAFAREIKQLLDGQRSIYGAGPTTRHFLAQYTKSILVPADT